MRLPSLRRQRRVELAGAAESPARLRSLAASYLAGAGERHARGIMDALLRYQRLSREERRRWLAHLFDSAPQPKPFALTGQVHGSEPKTPSS